MKPVFTSLDDFDNFLSQIGQGEVDKVLAFMPAIEGEFEKIEKTLKVSLTNEAALQFMDFENLKPELHKLLLHSGLMVDFDWEEWQEGEEILKGIRDFHSQSPLKIFKLLTLIIRYDQKENGYFDLCLKNRMILNLLLKLKAGNVAGESL